MSHMWDLWINVGHMIHYDVRMLVGSRADGQSGSQHIWISIRRDTATANM